ncbi:hypothetical protein [Aquiflexum gelatinilyticum]|uniref:Uncharacterized protein n=1 Tax=Aquiflexum gelatinilyticum TaxID=2961943 RepID=A0A9X2PDJ7_9BACT|nr:hypothetical protein [Aquiflexum gelatinilyticum]MCR9016765.1 hypothetical protein [Aquiflexum gelatinilyticum]
MKPTIFREKTLGSLSNPPETHSLPLQLNTRYKSPKNRKNLRFLPIVVITSLLACSPGDDLLPQYPLEQMDHQIDFRVAKAKDYSEEIFDGTKASLQLTLSLENMEDGKNTILWDTAFNLRELREFPNPDSPLLFQKNISEMVKANEVLRFSHIIRYFDRNNATWMEAKGETIPRDQTIVTLEIDL